MAKKEPTIEERVATNEANITNLTGWLEKMSTSVEDIKEKLLGRPTWKVLAVISTMSGIIGFLATALVKFISKG